jgi:predicted dehydrogenase
MMRLALCGATEAACRDVALCLRGATLQLCTDSCFDARPDEPDAVVLVGPAPLDAAGIERLLACGTYVLLAAQSFLPGEVLEGLAVTAERAGVSLAVVNPDRYLPSRQLIRQQLDRGVLGDVGLVRMHRWGPAADQRHAQLPLDLDLAAWLVGRPPEIVYAAQAGGCVLVHLGFSGGAMALIDSSDQLPPGDGYCSLSVIGSAGSAQADDHHNRQLVFQGGPPRAVRTGEGDAYLAVVVQEFVDALRADRDPPGSVAAWRPVVAVAGAVDKALASRQAVRLEGH